MHQEEEVKTSSHSTIASPVSSSELGQKTNMGTQFDNESKLLESTKKIKLLNTRIQNLMSSIAKLSASLLELQNENCVLKKQVATFQRAKESDDVLMNDKRVSLTKFIEDQDQQVKKLWSFIKMLEEENMALTYKSKLCEQREK